MQQDANALYEQVFCCQLIWLSIQDLQSYTPEMPDLSWSLEACFFERAGSIVLHGGCDAGELNVQDWSLAAGFPICPPKVATHLEFDYYW